MRAVQGEVATAAAAVAAAERVRGALATERAALDATAASLGCRPDADAGLAAERAALAAERAALAAERDAFREAVARPGPRVWGGAIVGSRGGAGGEESCGSSCGSCARPNTPATPHDAHQVAPVCRPAGRRHARVGAPGESRGARERAAAAAARVRESLCLSVLCVFFVCGNAIYPSHRLQRIDVPHGPGARKQREEKNIAALSRSQKP